MIHGVRSIILLSCLPVCSIRLLIDSLAVSLIWLQLSPCTSSLLICLSLVHTTRSCVCVYVCV